MKKKLSLFIIKLFGWKLVGIHPDCRKFVCIIAPHTSWWDFFFGRLALWALDLPAKFLIKKEFFVWPIRRILSWLGGIPVNREHARNTIPYCVSLFKNSDELVLAITPEGTRKYTEKWKMGFYYIAQRANVPLFIGHLDYKKKEIGILTEFKITGDIETDFIEIQNVLRGIHAKYPKNYNLS